jgi:hypothetical protein
MSLMRSHARAQRRQLFPISPLETDLISTLYRQMDIITRKEAKALGLKHYFSGVPCKRGHVRERCVSNRQCVECERERHEANLAAFLKDEA